MDTEITQKFQTDKNQCDDEMCYQEDDWMDDYLIDMGTFIYYIHVIKLF